MYLLCCFLIIIIIIIIITGIIYCDKSSYNLLMPELSKTLEMSQIPDFLIQTPIQGSYMDNPSGSVCAMCVCVCVYIFLLSEQYFSIACVCVFFLIVSLTPDSRLTCGLHFTCAGIVSQLYKASLWPSKYQLH